MPTIVENIMINDRDDDTYMYIKNLSFITTLLPGFRLLHQAHLALDHLNHPKTAIHEFTNVLKIQYSRNFICLNGFKEINF